jgi:hypothetical protein
MAFDGLVQAGAVRDYAELARWATSRRLAFHTKKNPPVFRWVCDFANGSLLETYRVHSFADSHNGYEPGRGVSSLQLGRSQAGSIRKEEEPSDILD